MSDLERFALRLRDEPGYSRNRRFDELSQPAAQRMRRQLRRLAGIARELPRAEAVTLRVERDGFCLILEFPSVRVRRETHLSRAEHALLRHLCPLPPHDQSTPAAAAAAADLATR